MTSLREAASPRLPADAAVSPPERRPFRDNPRLILLGIILLLAALVAMLRLADRSTELNPDFLSEVLLYALSAADLTMVVVAVFVLARNIVKLVVERRRGLPFSRFRAKLVLALLGLTIVPSLLVLLVGGELIRSSTQWWVSPPIDEVLRSATQIAGDYYGERLSRVSGHAARIASEIPASAVQNGDAAAVQRAIAQEIREGRVGLVEVYRLEEHTGARPAVVPVAAVQSPALPRGYVRATADMLAARVASGTGDPQTLEPLDEGGDHLSGELAMHSRRIRDAYEGYNKLRVMTRPLQGVYLSVFLMTTLMILVSATWTGLYLAKRITRPVQRLAAGAREIGAGHLDHRIEPETRDEFGSLVEAFNAMAGELAASQQKLERSRVDLEKKNVELDDRRRYIETVLERIATGVISLGPDGRIETVNSAALRLLDVDRAVVGVSAGEVFRRADLRPLEAVLKHAAAGAGPPSAQEVAVAREGRELHLAAAATPLTGEAGDYAGAVIVFDDVTPLIRTQRVAAWRDVARRLAHEIKNPLTPIQLCAERLRRHFSSAPPPLHDLVEECTNTIVGEVESLKALVDEFAQFARMPAPRTVPSNINGLLTDTLALYNGLFREIEIERRFADGLPPVRVDVEQIRRVIINLVDNAVEALGGSGAHARPDGRLPKIVVETRHDPVNAVARVVVSDNGPGIPPGDRDKLFMPYYSTKKRGSGLGLAIVRRIVAEHGGSIEVADNEPSGTRFTIELPL
jgi:two-component system, NtrC family, nitrogen regulation sensor histidine kinase NtrY